MEELKRKLKILLKKYKDINTLCSELGLEEYQIIGLVELLKQDGELIDYIDGKIVKLNKPLQHNDIYTIPNNLDHIKLLLISDTHLASKYDRVDILKYLYKRASEEGVKYVLHSGDFTDGRSIRQEQVFELKEPSYEGQIDYCINEYPFIEGIKTFIISGNHDDWWYKQCGSDIVKAICNQREDLIYLGSDIADVNIGNLKIRMFHGKGNQAYSKSYRVQKYLDSIPLEEKPDILQTGHIHQAFYMKQDKTHCFQTGCLEDQTPFTRSMGLNNDKSVWWVDVWFDKKGKVHKIVPELEEFDTKRVSKRK